MALLYVGDAAEKGVYSLELDGSNPTQLFIGLAQSINNPLYVESLDKFVFMEGDLYEVKSNGTGLRAIINPASPLISGLTVGIDLVNSQLWYSNKTDKQIRKMNYDGANDTLVLSTLIGPEGIVLDVAGEKFYWHTESTIRRATFPTGAGEEELVSGYTSIDQFALDLVNGKIYWVDLGNDKIYWANLDGTGEAVVIDVITPKTGGIAVDGTGGKLYWVLDAAHTVHSSDLNGDNNVEIWAGSTFPAGMSITPPAVTASAATTYTRSCPHIYLQGPGRQFIQRHVRP